MVVTVRRVKGTGGTAAVYIDPVGAAGPGDRRELVLPACPFDPFSLPVRVENRITVGVAFRDRVDAEGPGLPLRVPVWIAVPLEGHDLSVSDAAGDLGVSRAVRDPESALVVRSAVAAQHLTWASSLAGALSLNGDR